jgi:hypothetical protein
MELVKERISDRRVLKLIRQWLEAGVMEDGTVRETLAGAPQGGVISLLPANIYLNKLDRIRAARCMSLGVLVRYADDGAPRAQRAEEGPMCVPNVCNCLTDEGRPLGTGLQEQVSNHLRRLWSKAMVVSAEGKGPGRTRSGD